MQNAETVPIKTPSIKPDCATYIRHINFRNIRTFENNLKYINWNTIAEVENPAECFPYEEKQ